MPTVFYCRRGGMWRRRGFIESRFPDDPRVYRIIRPRNDAKLSRRMRRDRRPEARTKASIALFPRRIKARADFSLWLSYSLSRSLFQAACAHFPLNSSRATGIMLFNEFAQARPTNSGEAPEIYARTVLLPKM